MTLIILNYKDILFFFFFYYVNNRFINVNLSLDGYLIIDFHLNYRSAKFHKQSPVLNDALNAVHNHRI